MKKSDLIKLIKEAFEAPSYEAERKIKDLEQQLASQQGLQDVDWDIMSDALEFVVQNKITGSIFTVSKEFESSEKYRIIATRPKPKVKPLTPEQIEAVREFYKDASKAFNEGRSMTAEKWLKERGNE